MKSSLDKLKGKALFKLLVLKMEEVFYEEKCGRIISLLLSAALFLSMFPMLSALAADDAVVLDVGQGRIIVYSDGYVI